jgi:hypothetical protein
VKAAFRTPFCEVMLNASSTTLPAMGRGGHCADAATNENPHTANKSEYLNPARIIEFLYSPENRIPQM